MTLSRLPLPSPGEAWQGASGGVRVVVAVGRVETRFSSLGPGMYSDDRPATHVDWHSEGEGEIRRSTVAAWRLWQRSATRVVRA